VFYLAAAVSALGAVVYSQMAGVAREFD